MRTGKCTTNAVVVQTTDRSCWCGANRGHKFSVRAISIVHHNTLSDSFRLQILCFQPKQDSDQIRISFFKNRIESDSIKHYPIISDAHTRNSGNSYIQLKILDLVLDPNYIYFSDLICRILLFGCAHRVKSEISLDAGIIETTST